MTLSRSSLAPACSVEGEIKSELSDIEEPRVRCLIEIEIEIDELTPPEGRLLRPSSSGESEFSAAETTEVPFVGWLGLLRALSSMVAIESPDAPGRP